MGDMYDGARRKFAAKEISWTGDTIRAYMLDIGGSAGQYTPDYAAHEFLSAIPSTARIHNPVTLSGRVIDANGACDATDALFTAVPNGLPAVDGIVIYKQVLDVNGAEDPTVSPLIILLDSKFPVVVAEAAAINATSLRVDPLYQPLASGTVLDFGGGITATVNTAAVAGARSLAVDALAAAVSLGATANPLAANANLPIPPNGGDISFLFDNGADKIMRL